MTKTVYIRGTPLRLSDNDEVAQGGEAVIYKLPPTYVNAFKLYKQPSHKDFENDPVAQQNVRAKLEILQTKLREIPKNLPSRIITPIDFGTNSSGTRIEGYLMKFLMGSVPFWNYSQSDFRDRGGVDPNFVVKLHRSLYDIVVGAHAVDFTFGDFNSLNILVLGDEVYYVDTDSGQWGKYLSPLYTVAYVDPLLCSWDPVREVPQLARPHNKNSDWYAYTVMLMENMIYTGPYMGNYRPKDPSKRIHMYMRPLKRVTVWNKEVVYPKAALPLKVLPDDLISYFLDVFHHDKRGIFPMSLLDNLRWTKCSNCGQVHARGVCPVCAQAAPAAVKQKVIQRGKVVATRIFPTSGESGTILHAATQHGEFYFLYHDGSSLKREDRTVVSPSGLDTQIRYRVHGYSTLFAKNGRLVVAAPGKQPEVIPVGSYGALPVFDANGKHYYWTANGSLYRDGDIGPEFIGNVLEDQTLFWVGSDFGFGFWRAGDITSGFVFDVERRAINDDVKIPSIRGQLINSTATFSKNLVWFFTTTQFGGRTINHCTVINSDGKVLANAEAQAGDDSWLGLITGKCAIGEMLFSATDDGIVRGELSGDRIVVVREYPDTEPFVHTGSYLFPHPEGLVAITGQEIYILKIS